MAPAADVLDDAKSRVAQAVDRLADDLERLSHRIHANPELAFKEEKAAGWLAEGEPIPDRLGSSDVGNVSQVIPTIQPMVAIAPLGTAIHSREFADAAVKPLARAGLLAAAKTMAMTTLDLLEEPALAQRAKEEFAGRR